MKPLRYFVYNINLPPPACKHTTRARPGPFTADLESQIAKQNLNNLLPTTWYETLGLVKKSLKRQHSFTFSSTVSVCTLQYDIPLPLAQKQAKNNVFPQKCKH